ncbi:MAG: sigma 54-interacting transcriptional regulator [Chloracidobacterium sp.]|nr:sigma 54-interacting transcriptional regulator [Chloracidobacterium sp.]
MRSEICRRAYRPRCYGLEEQRFEPVGSNTPVSVDVRVISATNKPLDGLIENGNFRSDLFYRLNVIPFPDTATPRTTRGHTAAGRSF